jgi:riboflavin transporter FmnP
MKSLKYKHKENIMKQRQEQHEIVKRIVLIGLFTAITTVFSLIKIPVMGVTVKLDLPVVIIGAAVLGPVVGAWLTVIPTVITLFLGEAALFMTYNPLGTVLTLVLKGLLAGFFAGLIYKTLSKKHPIGAMTCASVAAPVINSGVFLLGCYLFIWNELVALAAEKSVSIAVLLLGLVIINFIIELLICLVVCPSLLRVIRVTAKNKK